MIFPSPTPSPVSLELKVTPKRLKRERVGLGQLSYLPFPKKNSNKHPRHKKKETKIPFHRPCDKHTSKIGTGDSDTLGSHLDHNLRPIQRDGMLVRGLQQRRGDDHDHASVVLTRAPLEAERARLREDQDPHLGRALEDFRQVLTPHAVTV